MEREKENPYVTQISLNKVEDRLKERIDNVDKKHTDNYSNIRTILERSIVTDEHLVKSNDKMVGSIESLTVELKKESERSREQNEAFRDKLHKHENIISTHDTFIKEQKEIKDNKRNSTMKWIGILVPVFVAFVAGLFGLVEIVLPFLFGGE